MVMRRPPRRRPVWASTRRRPSRSRLLFAAAAGLTLGTLVVARLLGTGVREAAPLVVVVGLIALGAALAFSSSTLHENTAEIGRGVLVSGLLALALLWVEASANRRDQDRQASQEARAQELEARSQRNADRQSLQVTIGLRQSLRGIDLRDRDLDGFYLAAKDLREAQLQGASARRANLRGADLSRTGLARADFRDATMTGVELRGVGDRRDALEGARAMDVDDEALVDLVKEIFAPADPSSTGPLDQADFRHADLRSAVLTRQTGTAPDFSRADLTDANISGATFKGAVFRSTRLLKVRAIKTTLEGADLRGAELWGARLDGVRLAGADLRGADLCGARLRRADLWLGSDQVTGLRGADLRGADLRGADLRGAVGLAQAQLRDAHFDAWTRWPRGFAPTRYGAVDRRESPRRCRPGNADDYLNEVLRVICVQAGPRPASPPILEVAWRAAIAGPDRWQPVRTLATRPPRPNEYGCPVETPG